MKHGNYIVETAPKDYPGKKYKGRYCYQHRLVWWRYFGVLPEGVIHHKNGICTDNRVENLEELSRGHHTSIHREPATFVTATCNHCGKEFEREARQLNSKKKSGQNNFYCSRKCLYTDSGKRKHIPKHGTANEYSYWKCRCTVCTEMHRERIRIYRKSKEATERAGAEQQ
jgi:hypothetical protein